LFKKYWTRSMSSGMQNLLLEEDMCLRMKVGMGVMKISFVMDARFGGSFS
jgi:hypothetical protein